MHTIVTGRTNSISAFRTEISTRDGTSLPGEFHLAHLVVLEQAEMLLRIISVFLSVNGRSSTATPSASTGLPLAGRGGWKPEPDKQTTPDLESESSAVNDDGFSLGSDCCSSNFLLFFSIYAPFVR